MERHCRGVEKWRHTSYRNRWAGGNQGSLRLVLKCLSCEMENSWRILSWGGLCLAFWMTGSSQEGRLASWEANCGGLHVRSWWGGKEERDALQTTPSETVTSCVRGSERKWLHIPGMASYVSGYWDYSENAGRSELVWGVPGDIYLERIGWQSVAEQSLLRLTPKSVPIGRSSAGTPTSVPVMYREGC